MLTRISNKYHSYGLKKTFVLIIKYPLRKLRWYLLLKNEPAKVFNTIYAKNFWESKESKSGEGSEITYTENLRFWLETNIPNYSIKSIVDAPCGDFNWMRKVCPRVDVDYLGLDIVDEVISSNISLYGQDKINFATKNIIRDRIPDCDLLIVRDCLFHFSFEHINQFLTNISQTKYKYLLTTTHILNLDFVNTDIRTGDFRKIDLFKAPFNFSREHITEIVDDYPEGHLEPKAMLLIEKKFVPISLSS